MDCSDSPPLSGVTRGEVLVIVVYYVFVYISDIVMYMHVYTSARGRTLPTIHTYTSMNTANKTSLTPKYARIYAVSQFTQA